MCGQLRTTQDNSEAEKESGKFKTVTTGLASESQIEVIENFNLEPFDEKSDTVKESVGKPNVVSEDDEG